MTSAPSQCCGCQFNEVGVLMGRDEREVRRKLKILQKADELYHIEISLRSRLILS